MNNGIKAMFLALVLSIAIGGFTLIQRGKAAEGDLIISGRGDAPATNPRASVSPQTSSQESGTTSSPPPQPTGEVVMHVAGAVNHPGVYHLPSSARIEDAVKAAGGAKSEANLDAVNLAAHVEDGKQLRIPKRGETVAVSTFRQSDPLPTPAPLTLSPSFSADSSPSNASHPQKLTDPGQGTININTASEEQLQRLPGIGRSYAARIVQFRSQYGAFSSPEQLMDVPGIGEKKFGKIRALIRIE